MITPADLAAAEADVEALRRRVAARRETDLTRIWRDAQANLEVLRDRHATEQAALAAHRAIEGTAAAQALADQAATALQATAAPVRAALAALTAAAQTLAVAGATHTAAVTAHGRALAAAGLTAAIPGADGAEVTIGGDPARVRAAGQWWRTWTAGELAALALADAGITLPPGRTAAQWRADGLTSPQADGR